MKTNAISFCGSLALRVYYKGNRLDVDINEVFIQLLWQP